MNYESLRDNTVTPLLAKYGKSVVITRPCTSVGYTKTFDGGEGMYKWTDGEGNVTYTDPSAGFPVTITGVGIEKAYKASEIDGTVVHQSDTRILVEASLAPVMGDWITFNSTMYKIQNVNIICPGDVVIVYECQCRE